MVVKVRYMYHLVYHQVKYLTSSWVVMGNNSANSTIGFRSKGRVITNNLYWSFIV